MKKSIFRSAITDGNGDVDVGYLALMWGLIGWLVSTTVLLLIGSVASYRAPAEGAAILQAIGIANGAVSGGFATMVGAVGLFRMGDKPRAETAGFVTTTTQDRTTVQTQSPSAEAPEMARGTAEKPLHVAVKGATKRTR